MDDFREVDFDPNTMTRATAEDIARIWKQLWCEWPTIRAEYHSIENGEYLDHTQEV